MALSSITYYFAGNEYSTRTVENNKSGRTNQYSTLSEPTNLLVQNIAISSKHESASSSYKWGKLYSNDRIEQKNASVPLVANVATEPSFYNGNTISAKREKEIQLLELRGTKSITLDQTSSLVSLNSIAESTDEFLRIYYFGIGIALMRATQSQNYLLGTSFLSNTISFGFSISNTSSLGIAAGIESFQGVEQGYATTFRDTVLYQNGQSYISKIGSIERTSKSYLKSIPWIGLQYQIQLEQAVHSFYPVCRVMIGASRNGAIARESLGFSLPFNNSLHCDMTVDYNQLFNIQRVKSSVLSGSIGVRYVFF